MTTTEPDKTADVLHDFGASWLALYRTINTDAREAQWQVGMTPTLPEDTTERSKGLVSDPTFTAVSDPRRIALRAQVKAGEHALAESLALIREISDRLRSRVAALDESDRAA